MISRKIWLTALLILIGVFVVVGGNTLGGRQAQWTADVAMEAPQAEMSVSERSQLASLGYLAAPNVLPEPPPPPGPPPTSGNIAHAAVLEASLDRLLIKNASLSLETESARDTAAQIMTKVTDLGGYVGNLSETQAAFGVTHAQLMVRVPAARLEETLAALEAMGKVLQKSVTSQDITEEFVDTEARLNNLRRTEDRLLDHLSRTAKLEDILRAEQEITRVREQVERLEGRLRFLKDRVSFSTINVQLQEAPGPEPVVPAATFSTGQEFTQAFRSVVEVFQGIWTAIIWVSVWGLLWIPLLIVVWIIGRRWTARQA